jgi:hypothetical protein
VKGDRVGGIEGNGGSSDLGLLRADNVLNFFMELVGYFPGMSTSRTDSTW